MRVRVRLAYVPGRMAVTRVDRGERLTRVEVARLRARVRAYLVQHGRTVASLAAELGRTPTGVNAFLRGGGTRRSVAAALAKACGLELDVVIADAAAPRDEGHGAVPAPPLREPRAALVRAAPRDLPLHPTRFHLAQLLEPFALLVDVPPGLDVRDLVDAEVAYRQARAIPTNVPLRHFLAANGRLVNRSPRDD
jgi:hypothetical protein